MAAFAPVINDRRVQIIRTRLGGLIGPLCLEQG
jgi:hypothetical protein